LDAFFYNTGNTCGRLRYMMSKNIVCTCWHKFRLWTANRTVVSWHSLL